jgi:hypothetical protein
LTLSPLTVYFVLQLDTIGDSISFLFFILLAIQLVRRLVCASGAAGNFTTGYQHAREQDKLDVAWWEEKLKKSPSWPQIIFLIVCFFCSFAFIPSTKTVAAAVIAPAIVNSKIVQQDIPELYNIGIERLKEAIKPTAKVEKQTK